MRSPHNRRIMAWKANCDGGLKSYSAFPWYGSPTLSGSAGVENETRSPLAVLVADPGLWQAVGMAKKRTKSDKAQRQADGLEKKLERRSAQVPKKKATRE